MKKLLFSLLIICASPLSGCFANAVITESKKIETTYVYPDSIWWSEADSMFAISGKRSPKETRCYILIPSKTLEKIKSEGGKVLLGRLARLSSEDQEKLVIRDGLPPSEYIDVTADRGASSIMSQSKSGMRPGKLLLLPFTIAIDVVTLPIAIPVAASLSGIN